MKNNLFLVVFFGLPFYLNAQISKNLNENSVPYQFFIGTELIEPLVTSFQSFGLSLGVTNLKAEWGLSYNHLNLPEKHLSNNSVKSVDGENVEGKLRFVRAYYNFHPFVNSKNYFLKSLYLAGNVGYINIEFTHIETRETHGTKSPAIGTGIGLFQQDLFKVKGLFLDFTIPALFLFDGLEEAYLGEARIRKMPFTYQSFLFIGYRF